MSYCRKPLFLTAVLAAVLTLFAAPPAAAQVTPVSLHPDGKTQSFAEDINNSGQVVGGYTVETFDENGQWVGVSTAVIWNSAGAMTELDPDRTLGNTWAKGINDSGMVYGALGFLAGTGVGAFIWDSVGGLVRVPKLVHNGVTDWTCTPTAMNDDGWLIGNSASSAGVHGWIYREGTLEEITDPTVPGSRVGVFAINNLGQVAGKAYFDTYSAVLWQKYGDTVTITYLAPDLIGSEARAINDAGQVVIDHNGKVYLWKAGTRTPVTLPATYETWYTQVVGMDEDGRIFGTGYASGSHRLWMWENGAVTECAIIVQALGGWEELRINNAGQMTGYMMGSGGMRHGFLWNGAEGQSGLQMLDDPAGGAKSAGRGLNDSGAVAGFFIVSEGYSSWKRACVWGLPSNQPPVLDVSDAPSYGVVGVPVTFTAIATDPDAGDTLTFSLPDAPAGAAIDPATGEFTWTPTEAGTFTFDVMVEDQADGVAVGTVTINVSALAVSDATVTARNSKVLTVTMTLTNSGAATAYDVTVTASTLDGVNTNAPLPLIYGVIKPGQSKRCTLQFKNVPAGERTLTVGGTCSLGSFFRTQQVNVP